MKEKLEAILKEASISEAAARQISEGVLTAFDSWAKKQQEIRDLEDKETFNLVKENLEKVTVKHQTELKAVQGQLSEAKEDFQKRLNAAREGVKKLIEEDYALHKKELAQKVKLFVEGKWQETEQVIREQVEKELREEAVTKKVNQLSESITKYIATETQPVKEVVKEDKEAVTKLQKEVETLKVSNASLLKENTSIKAENKQLHEKLQKTTKPLIQKVNESKISKVLDQKQEQKEETNSFMNEVVRLATYNMKI